MSQNGRVVSATVEHLTYEKIKALAKHYNTSLAQIVGKAIIFALGVKLHQFQQFLEQEKYKGAFK